VGCTYGVSIVGCGCDVKNLIQLRGIIGGIMMAWVYLFCAGCFEIGWPVGLKMAQQEGIRALGVVIALLCMGVSGLLLWLAQKEIPIGTSYAVWTGIGAAGTFLVGVFFYGDPGTLARYFGVMLIVCGVAVLKFAS